MLGKILTILGQAIVKILTTHMNQNQSVSVRESIRAYENRQITLVGRHCQSCGLDFFVPANQSKALAEKALHCPDCGAQSNQLLFSLVVEKIHIVEPLKARAASADICAR